MEVRCQQCGAQIVMEKETLFVHCAYCTSTFYFDSGAKQKHQISQPQLQERHLNKILRQDLYRHQIKSDVIIRAAKIYYVPFWKTRQHAEAFLAPAYVTHLAEFYRLNLPGLDYKYFAADKAAGGILIDPTLTAVEAYANNPHITAPFNEAMTVDLYHLPFYQVDYSVENHTGLAWIEAGQGRIVYHAIPKEIIRILPHHEFKWIVPMFLLLYAVGMVLDDLPKILAYGFIIWICYWYWLPKQKLRDF